MRSSLRSTIAISSRLRPSRVCSSRMRATRARFVRRVAAQPAGRGAGGDDQAELLVVAQGPLRDADRGRPRRRCRAAARSPPAAARCRSGPRWPCRACVFIGSAAAVRRVEVLGRVRSARGGGLAVAGEPTVGAAGPAERAPSAVRSAGRLVEADQRGRLGRAVGQFVEERLGRVHVTACRGAAEATTAMAVATGGEGERQVQAAGERLLDQLREERPAGDVGGLAGRAGAGAPRSGRAVP